MRYEIEMSSELRAGPAGGDDLDGHETDDELDDDDFEDDDEFEDDDDDLDDDLIDLDDEYDDAKKEEERIKPHPPKKDKRKRDD